MSYEACPNPDPACPFYNQLPPKVLKGQEHGCKADLDHKIPQRLGQTVLQKLYLNLPEFLEQTCRWEHEQRNARHDAGDESDIPPFPSRSEMLKRVTEAIMENEIVVSKTKARKLYGNRPYPV